MKSIFSKAMKYGYLLLVLWSAFVAVLFLFEKQGINIVWESDSYFHPIGLLNMVLLPLYVLSTLPAIYLMRKFWRKHCVLLGFDILIFVFWAVVIGADFANGGL